MYDCRVVLGTGAGVLTEKVIVHPQRQVSFRRVACTGGGHPIRSIGQRLGVLGTAWPPFLLSIYNKSGREGGLEVLICDAHEWINEIPTVPTYYLAKPQPRERAWHN